ncbi:MAG: tetratricopeptide repeat protein [Sedimentisphaerales bacterium]|nr:tetratricopeptide repeat protein [Sedimentisphaerales bacterium]
MSKQNKIFWSMITLPTLLYIIGMSVFFSPCVQGVNLENDFKNYYLAYSKGKPDALSGSQRRIQQILDSIPRIRRSPDTSLERAIWVGMLSGNENIALTSGAVHFSYLIENDKTTSIFTLILSCLIYTSLFLVGVSGIWHNVLTYVMRLDVIPTKSYLRYAVQYFKNLSTENKEQKVPLRGYVKTFYAYIPYWLIGIVIGYINGDYQMYVQSPVVPGYLLICACLYCVCIGSSLVLSINQIILFLFMRFNADVVTRYVDDVICAVLAIGISKWIFNNGLGTTIAVTVATLLYTIMMNNRTRAVSVDEYEKTALSAIGCANLGLHYHRKKKIKNAIEMFKQAIDIYTDLGQINDTAPVYGSLGKLYFDNGDLDLAEDNLQQALRIYRRCSHAQEAIATITPLLDLIAERRQRCDEPKAYTNAEYCFSFIIPADWLKQRLAQEFTTTGGQIAISHKTHRATFNVSVGPPDRPEWIAKEARTAAVREFLAHAPGRIGHVEITTSVAVGGEPNTVAAEYETETKIRSVRRRLRNGLISIIHIELEYALQWSAERDLEGQVKGIIDSFKFET